MDRRTFLKAVGASVAGAFLPVIPEASPMTFRGVPFTYIPGLGETPEPKLIGRRLDEFAVHESAFHKQMVKALDDAGFYGYGVCKVDFNHEVHYEPIPDTEFYKNHRYSCTEK